jgi:hypothetical protein
MTIAHIRRCSVSVRVFRAEDGSTVIRHWRRGVLYLLGGTMAGMSSEEDPVAWLRAQVEADLAEWRELVAAYLPDAEREGGMLLFRAQERVADLEAKLAILGLYEEQTAKAGKNAMEEDRAWVLAPVVALLASGYRHREGYPERFANTTGSSS